MNMLSRVECGVVLTGGDIIFLQMKPVSYTGSCLDIGVYYRKEPVTLPNVL